MARAAMPTAAVADPSTGSAPDPDSPFCLELPVFSAGRVIEHRCSDRLETLTAIDLSDDWAPSMLREEAGVGAADYRKRYVELADGNLDAADDYLELYGIPPTFRVLRERAADEQRHTCHARVDDEPLRKFESRLESDAHTSRQSREEPERIAAIRVLQAHLVCEGMLSEHLATGKFGPQTLTALSQYRRKHAIPLQGGLDQQTRELLLINSRELDFRAALRALRERVFDATGLIEDGSARGRTLAILDRNIDAVSLPKDLAEYVDGAADDLLSPATEAAAVALGWTDAERFLAFFEQNELQRVAVALPARPSYHRPGAMIRALIELPERGPSGKSKSDDRWRPTLFLILNDGEREVVLARWPTTMGGWQREKLSTGKVVRRFKPSDVGSFAWRQLIAAPVWFAPDSTPDHELVRGTKGHQVLRHDTIGPGYRSAYGLVMLVHEKVKTIRGETRYEDNGIRTHGTGDYRSVLVDQRGSHGCHRLFSPLANRLGTFLLRYRPHVVRGKIPARYVHHVEVDDRVLTIRRNTRGFGYELTPPVPIEVRSGSPR